VDRIEPIRAVHLQCIGSANRASGRACIGNRLILVVVAKQRQVDRVGHGPVADIVGMDVIAAVIRWQQARGMTRIAQQLVEANDGVISVAGPDPVVDGLAFRLESGRPEAGKRVSLSRRPNATSDASRSFGLP
jgi:hypothetical protein